MIRALRMLSARLIGFCRGLFHNSVFQQLTVYGLGASTSQLLMMIYTILVARSLGPEGNGLFAGNYALAALTIFLVNWGMDTWMLREAGNHPNTHLLGSTVLQSKLLAGLLWLLLLVVSAPMIRPTLFPRMLLLICALDILGDSMLVTLISVLNIQRNTRTATWLLLFTRGGRLISMFVLILIGNHQPVFYAGMRLIATAVGMGSTWLIVRPSLSQMGVSRSVSTFKSSLSYGIPELLALVYAQVDVTLLGLIQGKLAIGHYAPAVSLINALTVVPNSIFFIVVPILSKKYLSEVQSFKKAFFQVAGIYCLVGSGLTIGAALVIKPLMTFLLGGKYLFSGNLALLMSPIMFFKSVSFACATYLVVVNWQAKRIGPQLVSAVANVGLNLMFIPIYGSLASAYIFVSSEMVLAVGYLILVVYHYRRFQTSNVSPIADG